ncbi:MAG: hypothetical protein IT572_08050 [Deltaproteobacteria bacterium]|nr:hypothetical protein [Deltaproteobacteria bacterium]
MASAVFGMVACGDGNGGGGGGGTIDPGTGTGNAAADTQSNVAVTQANAQTGVQKAIDSVNSSMKFASINITDVPCAGGGTFVVSGDATDGDPITFDLDMDLTGCTSMDGSISVVGTADVETPSILYNYKINGDVGSNGCVVTFDNFALKVEIPDLTNFLNGLFSLDGEVGGVCTNGDATCDYDALEVNFSGGTASGSVSCS